MFPLADDNRDRRTTPVVTYGLIAANVLVFVFFQGMGENQQFTLAFACVPAEIVRGKDLVTPDRVVQVSTPVGIQEVRVPGLKRTPIPVYFTLLTAMFLHGGLAHLLGNMWFLWIFGDNIEDDLGRVRYLLFYLACGILASLTHVVVSLGGPSAEVPSLGASGAISGVLGAYLLLHPMRRVTVLMFRMIVDVPGYVAVGLWFLFQVINGLGMLGGMPTGVAYGAHIGGFVAGAALIWPFKAGYQPPPPQRQGFHDWHDWEGEGP